MRWIVASALLLRTDAFGTGAHRRVRASGPSGDEGIAQLVSNLDSLIDVFTKEKSSGKAVSKARAKQCKATAQELDSLVARGETDTKEAEEDLEAIDAEVAGLRTEIRASKDNVKAVSKEIDELVQRLATLREEEKQRREQAAKSLQQVKTVISQTSLRQRAARLQEAHKGSLRRSEVSYLKELGDRLAFDGARSTSPAFLQLGADTVAGSVEAPEGMALQAKRQLQSDGKEIEEASNDGDKTFDEQEKELIELIRLKREELLKLEDILRGQQPALADKLKQAAETNRTLLAAGRASERDGAMLIASKRKCDLMATTSSEEGALRSKLLDALKISTTLLEHVDTTAFITKDMGELRGLVTSFVQAQSRTLLRSPRSKDLSHAVSLAEPPYSHPVPWSLLQAAAAATASRTAVSSSPFDSISQMIEGLISSLKAEANGDVDQHQFCEETKTKNRKARHLADNWIDEKTTEIHWTSTSVERLDDEIAFLEGESTRLVNAILADQTEAKVHEKRFKEEAEHRAKADEVIDGAISVLVELCELGSGGGTLLISRPSTASANAETISFVGEGRSRRDSGSRGTQCGKAVEELKVAKQQLAQLTQVVDRNVEELRSLMSGILEKSRLDSAARNSDLLAVKRARGRRADELAAAKAELAVKQKDLALIQEAQRDLEQNCGPRQETHEERKQRREQEIDALKNALSVLEGESVPVDSDA
jgi:hypothetical protein